MNGRGAPQTAGALAPRGLGESLYRLIHTESSSPSTLEVARRGIVYSCLDGDKNIYFVERGQVKAVTSSREGKDCLLGIYTAGDLFGELCLIGEGRTETVIAMTPTVLKRIASQKVVAALGDAGLREEFIRYLARRLFEQQQLITHLVTDDSEHRLAAILLHLARKLGKPDGHLLRIEERITQEELSGMVGTTRSRVGHFLKRFRNAGLVTHTRDCFLVVDAAGLHGFLARGYHASHAAGRPA